MALAPPSLKQTTLWKSLRACKRWLTPPGPARQHDGSISIIEAEVPAVLEVAQQFTVSLTLINTGADAWPAQGIGAVSLKVVWLTPAWTPLSEPTTITLLRAVYSHEPQTLPVTLTAPIFVGDYQLVISTSVSGPLSATVSIPVLGKRTGDIDYHSVYKTANLAENHWWVVGGYYSREQYEESTRSRRTMLENEAGLTPQSRVLDVGCGTGQVGDSLHDYLTDQGAYYGCDIGREAIAFCQDRFARPNFHFQQSTMMEIPFSSQVGLFNLAIYFSVFTHTYIDESVRLLGETRRLLHADGVIVVDVIVSPLVERGLGNRGEMVVNQLHFEKLCEVAGFTTTVIGRWPWNPHAERLMLILRRLPN